MTSNGNFSLELTQRDAWEAEIAILKDQLCGITGYVFLEFDVPRIGSRIDAVVAAGPLLIILEFKVGESEYRRADLNQAWDYALDLKNFHEGSHQLTLLPLLVATEATTSVEDLSAHHRDGVYTPMQVNRLGIRKIIELGLEQISGAGYSATKWAESIYKPTPTIIEAAQRLFSDHSVEAITQHDAGKENLAITARKVERLIEKAEATKQKKTLNVLLGNSCARFSPILKP